MANVELAGYAFDKDGNAIQDMAAVAYADGAATAITDTSDGDGLWELTTAVQSRYDVKLTHPTDGSVFWRKYLDKVQFDTADIGDLRLRYQATNDSDDFMYVVTPGAITADRILNLPVITATDTLATLGLAQTVSAIKTHSADIIIQDDVDLALGTGSDILLRLSSANAHASSSDEDMVLGLSDDNQALHITDKAAVATDWNLADDTHPTVYVHSNTTPATDYTYLGRHDGTTGHLGVGGGTLTMDSTWADLGAVTTVDINGGTVDGATIGAASATTVVSTLIRGTDGTDAFWINHDNISKNRNPATGAIDNANAHAYVWVHTAKHASTGASDYMNLTVYTGAGGAVGNALTVNGALLATFGAEVSLTAGKVTMADGGTVAQATNKSTGVTLNTHSGQITMDAAELAAATEVSFTLTNSTIGAYDVVIVNHGSAGTTGAYSVQANNVQAGQADITISNLTAGALSEAIVLHFVVVGGAAS